MGEYQKYADKMGKSAGAAARLASFNQVDKALARAKDAAGQRELLHPKTWALWDAAPDELFESAMALMTAEERGLLREARDPCDHNGNIALAFCGSERKLRVLTSLGVDLDAPCPYRPYIPTGSRVSSPSGMSPIMRCCFDGDLEGVAHLSSAGASPPPALSSLEAEQCPYAAYDPRSSLHALALSSFNSSEITQDRLDGIVAWLATGVSVSLRNKKGLDPFKLAMSRNQNALCESLIRAGADLNLKEANGLDAFEYLAKLLKDKGSLSASDARERHDMAKRLAPAMTAWSEQRGLERALPVAEAASTRRPGL